MNTECKVQKGRGYATVLKVGDKFCERIEQEMFWTPLFGQWGTKYCLDIAKSA